MFGRLHLIQILALAQASRGVVPPASPDAKWAIPVRGGDALPFDVLVD